MSAQSAADVGAPQLSHGDCASLLASTVIDCQSARQGASAWIEHVPFAFWIVEALRPRCIFELGTYTTVSYLAFRQAVDRLGPGTACHAVDTGEGDEHSEFVGEGIYGATAAWNAIHYGRFSRLIRPSFAEARAEFSAGEVDLVHIGGLHTYEAVATDYGALRDSLSERGVILFHDTRGFGCGRFFRELCKSHPHFEFVHGHGLGVLGVGSRLPDSVRTLLAVTESPTLTYQVRSRFAARGEALRQAAELSGAPERLTHMEAGLSAERQRAQTAPGSPQATRSRADILSAQLGVALDHNKDHEQQVAAANGKLAEGGRLLEAVTARAERAEASLKAAQEELRQQGAALCNAHDQARELEAQLGVERRQAAAQGLLLEAASTRAAGSAGELEEARRLLEGLAAELEALRWQAGLLEEARGEAGGLRLALGQERHRADGLLGALWERDARLAKLRERLHQRLSAGELQALEEQARLVGESHLFDREWYLAQNPDVLAAGADPAIHYLLHGAEEGRSPGPDFDGPWYLEHYPDVTAAGWNPLLHFLTHGMREGRTTRRRCEGPEPEPPAPGLSVGGEDRACIAIVQSRNLGLGAAGPSRPRVCVGIVTYNTPEDELARVVSSAEVALARAGAQVPCGILILDNGAASMVDRPSVLRLPSMGNVGFGAAHNILMQEAFGRGTDLYVAVNPDGLLHPDAILGLHQMALASQFDAIIEAVQFPEEHPKVYDPLTFETPWASGACLAIPRRVHASIGGFDDGFFMYCEDVDLSWRARAAGHSVRTCPRALFLHSVAGRADDPEVRRRHLESGWRLARKWRCDEYTTAMARELELVGQAVPEEAPEPVPPSWAVHADFSRNFHFAATRW